MPADGQTLDIILGTPAYYRLFYAFAKQSLTQENLDFLAAAAAYRKDPSKKKAIGIIDEFVKDSGAASINIDYGMRGSIVAQGNAYGASRGRAKQMGFFKRHWSAGQRKAAENVFDDAITEIRTLVIADTLPKFFRTSTGQAVEADIAKKQAKAAAVRGALLETGFM